MFYLFISGTEISKVPGLSAAGANPDVIPLTSPADADVIRFGFPEAVDCFPMDPEGHPTPAIITRAAEVESGMPICVVRAGTYLPPAPPYVETGASFGRNPGIEPSVPDAKKIYERSRHFAENAASSQKFVMLAESIPGGTTTALLTLRALGIEGMVSSGGPNNPISLKEKIWSAASGRIGIKKGGLADDPFRAVTEMGDPMQASVLGFIAGLRAGIEVVLAGGTQMIAVAALLSRLQPSFPKPLIATTKYVAEDKSSNFQELASALGLETHIAQIDFSKSPHKGLSDYEKGYVKEGVGAGGATLYAERLGVPLSRVLERTNAIYAQVVGQNVA
ncbi:MAG: TIGR00303 family protein [Synergistaceae bacterium]|jgi:uncharacterized protein (TIGR00303 family)|nr:TIGR00303 family protein [Synergistaceae bacterium]